MVIEMTSGHAGVICDPPPCKNIVFFFSIPIGYTLVFDIVFGFVFVFVIVGQAGWDKIPKFSKSPS